MNRLLASGPRAVSATLLVALLAVCSGGCAHVPAYDRGVLAHPTMSAAGMSGPGEAHVYAIHEGAVGGTVGAEGGCGCN